MYVHQEQKLQLLEVGCIKAALEKNADMWRGKKTKKSIVANLATYQSIFASKLKQVFVWRLTHI